MTSPVATSPRNPEAKRFLNDRLDWNLLRTFLVIAQEGSISRAAARLHLSQPAVSQALKRLEEQLDSALVVRRGPRIALSKAGEEVMQIAAELYGTMSRLGPALDTPTETVTGKIRLLSISRIQSRCYDDFLAQFHNEYPQVELEIDVLRSSDVVSALLQKTASFGLSLCRTPQPKLEQRVLLEQRYAFFCGKRHRLFGRKNLTLGDLQGENFVSFTSDQIGGNLSPLTVFRDQQGFTGRIVASSPSLDEILRLVEAGFGIGCLPEHIVAAHLQANELWRLPPWDGVIDVNVYLLWNREQKLTQAESIFLERFRQMLMTTDSAERF
ncbi:MULTISPECIES: LysR family transcriptional regulator [Pseudomonas]|uniref:LysR family transcriptional regulator n=1 Tax=Pseudomonas taiwanensis TaxID=470150 RepID=A0ABR6V5Z1_9PSED|nr:MULTISPECIES: LysR family transcriptional regulator [Pseudomonas]MBC3475812.1 LysR family transcriptional regulator [Pseudomonas taiwanensis]BDM22287.1 LysR family transcriptional regulator [Pseudomonas sp. LRP2-20]